MTTEIFIGSTRASAPLFKGTPAKTLQHMVNLLSNASFHRASDVGGWGMAQAVLEEFTDLAIKHELSSMAIKTLVTARDQLVTTDEMVDRVINKLRAKITALSENEGRHEN